MSVAFYEQDHQAVGSFPYIALNNVTNYIAHFHEEIEVIYVTKGDMYAYSGPNEINLKDGDICIFMPGEIHSFSDINFSNMSIMKIGVHCFSEKIDFEKLRLHKNKITKTDSIYKDLQPLLVGVFDEYATSKKGYEFAIRQYKNEIIKIILRNLDYDVVDTTKNTQFLNLINKYLELNFTNEITLEEIAKYCHFSKYYFAHKLKSVTGMSFVQYLTTFRARKAASLLAGTEIKITEIALNCGFNNLRSFNRAFLSTYNMTPSSYRKMETQ